MNKSKCAKDASSILTFFQIYEKIHDASSKFVTRKKNGGKIEERERKTKKTFHFTYVNWDFFT